MLFWRFTRTVTPGGPEAPWSISDAQCLSSAPPGATVDLGALAAAAFRRVRPRIDPPVIQPPGGVTLANFDTIFYSTTRAQDVPLVLLGTPVTLRITPISYRWDFGDGETLSTASAGAPYPNHDVVHRYRDAARVAASVTVTYRGEYAPSGGSFTAISGTVDRASGPVALQVRTARAELVRPEG